MEMACSFGKMAIFIMGNGVWDYKMVKESK